MLVARPDLFVLARDAGIGVEVCLTSNRLTGVVRDMRAHPMRSMRLEGLPVCLCADNTLVYDTTLSREYSRCVEAGLATLPELLDLLCVGRRDGFS